MKCPRCGLAESQPTVACPGCGFTLDALNRSLGDPPVRTGRLDDGAGVLDEPERVVLEARLQELSERSGGEIVIVTRESTAPVRPSEYAFWLFNRWDLAAPHRRGLLVLLALHEQRIETEIGFGWEDVATDATTGAALDHHVMPLLHRRAFAAALNAAAESLGSLVSATEPPAAGGAR